VKGDSVSYSYPFAYLFPLGSNNDQLTVTYPKTESYVSFDSSQCRSSSTSFFGTTLTIRNACSSTYILYTAATGSYSSSISPSITQDSWYDIGNVVSLSASSVGPFSFVRWTDFGAGNIMDSLRTQTSLTVTGPASIVANFQVSP
jgi:hypothetical protein